MGDEETRETVLVVASDDGERRRLAAGLEDAGFEVMECPGPSGPDYTCVGTRTLGCPLASGASVVVLDTDLDGDDVMEGPPSDELIGVYLFAGQRVIALGGPRHDEAPGQLIRLHRCPEPVELLAAVASLAAAGPVDRL